MILVVFSHARKAGALTACRKWPFYLLLSVFENQTLRLCWILEVQIEIEEWKTFLFLSVFFFSTNAQINLALVNKTIKDLNGKSVMDKFNPKCIMIWLYVKHIYVHVWTDSRNNMFSMSQVKYMYQDLLGWSLRPWFSQWSCQMRHKHWSW